MHYSMARLKPLVFFVIAAFHATKDNVRLTFR
jgi:hypothetical protein